MDQDPSAGEMGENSLEAFIRRRKEERLRLMSRRNAQARFGPTGLNRISPEPSAGYQLHERWGVARPTGLEPVTPRSVVWCSIH